MYYYFTLDGSGYSTEIVRCEITIPIFEDKNIICYLIKKMNGYGIRAIFLRNVEDQTQCYMHVKTEVYSPLSIYLHVIVFIFLEKYLRFRISRKK